jgi:hypothetical protein
MGRRLRLAGFLQSRVSHWSGRQQLCFRSNLSRVFEKSLFKGCGLFETATL